MGAAGKLWDGCQPRSPIMGSVCLCYYLSGFTHSFSISQGDDGEKGDPGEEGKLGKVGRMGPKGT